MSREKRRTRVEDRHSLRRRITPRRHAARGGADEQGLPGIEPRPSDAIAAANCRGRARSRPNPRARRLEPKRSVSAMRAADGACRCDGEASQGRNGGGPTSRRGRASRSYASTAPQRPVRRASSVRAHPFAASWTLAGISAQHPRSPGPTDRQRRRRCTPCRSGLAEHRGPGPGRNETTLLTKTTSRTPRSRLFQLLRGPHKRRQRRPRPRPPVRRQLRPRQRLRRPLRPCLRSCPCYAR